MAGVTPADELLLGALIFATEVLLDTSTDEPAMKMAALNHSVANRCIEYAEDDPQRALGHADHFCAELHRIIKEELKHG